MESSNMNRHSSHLWLCGILVLVFFQSVSCDCGYDSKELKIKDCINLESGLNINVTDTNDLLGKFWFKPCSGKLDQNIVAIQFGSCRIDFSFSVSETPGRNFNWWSVISGVTYPFEKGMRLDKDGLKDDSNKLIFKCPQLDDLKNLTLTVLSQKSKECDLYMNFERELKEYIPPPTTTTSPPQPSPTTSSDETTTSQPKVVPSGSESRHQSTEASIIYQTWFLILMAVIVIIVVLVIAGVIIAAIWIKRRKVKGPVEEGTQRSEKGHKTQFAATAKSYGYQEEPTQQDQDVGNEYANIPMQPHQAEYENLQDLEGNLPPKFANSKKK